MLKYFLSITFLLIICFFPSTSHAAGLSKAPNNLGLVGYWPLNDGSGSIATDASGNGNTGTVYGSKTWGNGKRGKALDANGTGDYVDITATTPLKPATELTISAWFKADALNCEWNPVVEGGGNLNTGTGYYFGFYSCSNDFYMMAGNGVYASAAKTLTTGVWYHAVGVFSASGGYVRLYINGQQAANTAHGNSSITYDASPVSIGRLDYCCTSAHLFDGLIDDVRIYNRALSATEAASLYQSGSITHIAPDNTGLVGYWSFNEGGGSQAGDFSGNINNGSLSGGYSWTDGKRGKGLSFDGSTGYVQVAHNANLDFGTGSFTVSAWVKRPDTSTKILFGKRAYPPGWVVYFTGSNLAMQYNDATPRVFTLGSFSDLNKWHFITVVVNKSTNFATYYLDGVAATPVDISATTGSVNNSAWFGIARDYSDSSVNFNGSIDEVRLYNRALSAADVLKLYQSNSTNVNSSRNSRITNGLVGLWSFDGPDVSGSTIYDRSGSNNTGTINGTIKPSLGKMGQAMSFDGSSYITASSVSLSRYTVSAWVKPNGSQTGTAGVISDMYPSYVNYTIAFDPGTLNIFAGTYNAGWYQTPRATLTSGEWALVTATFDGSYVSLYINGAYFDRVAASITPQSSGTQLRIGRRWDLADYFNGTMDDVRVYNRALSADEILQLYNLGK